MTAMTAKEIILLSEKKRPKHEILSPTMMTVKKTTLLSIEEYVKYKPIIPLVEDWWWLRSPSKVQDRAVTVLNKGIINKYGNYVDDDSIAVRLAIHFNLDPSDSIFWYKPEKLIGTKIKYGIYSWTVLDTNFGELYALCDDTLCCKRFDPKSNDWNTSELKRWLGSKGI